ncbi:MaoC family dehydratase [Streptomyces sp. SBT349]|uniref:MaoC family dehydratase n=1 Tax=Streptomyces sp. SBT349 TaxID=1580539 RepID=UPI00066B1797|nr:MaoC/PaaZ C-terminal domain-containing protein [Streptomyces sp. SBT349]
MSTLPASYARALLLPRGGGPLPEGALSGPPNAADPARLARYAAVCGFRRADRLPPTYPHIAAFPLAMELMTRRDFPFRLPGLVHLGCRIEHRRPLAPGEPLSFRVEAAGPVPHPGGTAFDITTEATEATEATGAGGAAVWRSAATYLSRRRGPSPRRPDAPGGSREPRASVPGEVWDVPAATGRRYAAVSRDRNPIHLHPLPARLFGFPRAIAHGMWSLARCLAALEDGLPDAFTAEARFRAPIPLPGRVTFAGSPRGPFTLRATADGRPHLEGRVTPG